MTVNCSLCPTPLADDEPRVVVDEARPSVAHPACADRWDNEVNEFDAYAAGLDADAQAADEAYAAWLGVA